MRRPLHAWDVASRQYPPGPPRSDLTGGWVPADQLSGQIAMASFPRTRGQGRELPDGPGRCPETLGPSGTAGEDWTRLESFGHEVDAKRQLPKEFRDRGDDLR